MNDDPLDTAIARSVWDRKYRLREPGGAAESCIQDTWRRIARALASVEAEPQNWAGRFYQALEGFRFLPGGRIYAGAGSVRRVTLLNCFVMGTIEDSMDGIFDALKEGALTMQQGGGVGYDFSTLRPAGLVAEGAGTVASGPLSFMHVWDAMCATVLSTGARRGAMMATLRCDHPDLEAFVEAKRDDRALRHFNLSVVASDDFMDAVRRDEVWPLVFPSEGVPEAGRETIYRRWSGSRRAAACRVLRRIRARLLWDRITRAAYDVAEPGVLFGDRIESLNHLYYRESIAATNPCGEIPLPPYGACDLGSINLTRFVSDPFGPNARLDLAGIAATARVATRMLDDVIDVSGYPLPAQAEAAAGSRRVGLGITGLADALIMLRLHYGSDAAREAAAAAMAALREGAYEASIELAREKGTFPYYERAPFLEGPHVAALPAAIRDGIARHGLRNSHLTAIAPAGTISLLAGNVSSGIEPVFRRRLRRRLVEPGGGLSEQVLADYAYRLWRERSGQRAEPPAYFAGAGELGPEAHLAMQAALHPYVDNAISKTINCPAEMPFEDFQDVYLRAYRLGLKGCTAFRPNPTRGAILDATGDPDVHCCSVDREAD